MTALTVCDNTLVLMREEWATDKSKGLHEIHYTAQGDGGEKGETKLLSTFSSQRNHAIIFYTIYSLYFIAAIYCFMYLSLI